MGCDRFKKWGKKICVPPQAGAAALAVRGAVGGSAGGRRAASCPCLSLHPVPAASLGALGTQGFQLLSSNSSQTGWSRGEIFYYSLALLLARPEKSCSER